MGRWKIKNNFYYIDKEMRFLKFSGMLVARKEKYISIRGCYGFYIFYFMYYSKFCLNDNSCKKSILISWSELDLYLTGRVGEGVFSILLFLNTVSLVPINILKPRKLNIGNTFIIWCLNWIFFKKRKMSLFVIFLSRAAISRMRSTAKKHPCTCSCNNARCIF